MSTKRLPTGSRRITPAEMETAFATFLLELSMLTAINEFRFANWVKANRHELQCEFYQTDEPTELFGFETWARLKFRATNGFPL